MNRYWVSWSDCFEDESVARMDIGLLQDFADSVREHLASHDPHVMRSATIFNDKYCFSASCVVEALSAGDALDTAQEALGNALARANTTADLQDPTGWYLSLLREATVKELSPAA